MNAFEKKDVKVAMKDVNLAYQVLAAVRKALIESYIAPREPGPYPSNRHRELLENCPAFKPQPAIR
jgi:hypothetical protein